MVGRRSRSGGRGGGKGDEGHGPVDTSERAAGGEQGSPTGAATVSSLHLVPRSQFDAHKAAQSARYVRFSRGIAMMLDADYSCFHRILPGPLADAERVACSRAPLPSRCAGHGVSRADARPEGGFQWFFDDGEPGLLRLCTCRIPVRGPFTPDAQAASTHVPRFLVEMIGPREDDSNAPRLGAAAKGPPAPAAATVETVASGAIARNGGRVRAGGWPVGGESPFVEGAACFGSPPHEPDTLQGGSRRFED